MEHSRKVILVISKNFTLSKYCDYEMNLARMQSVEQGRELIVPILLEWPKREGEQDDFWMRLREVLNTNNENSFFGSGSGAFDVSQSHQVNH